jgi:hypothetical protein
MNPIDAAVPAMHFAHPPYTAQPAGGPYGWWYVENRQGINCLTFTAKPGAVFTDEASAKAIAEKWNQP